MEAGINFKKERHMNSRHTLPAQATQLISQDVSEEQAARIGLREEAGSARGLCRTCDHRKECTFAKTGGLVLNCEELDYPPGPSEPKAEPGFAATLSVAEPCSADDSENLIGLCRTCENRFDCQFPKPAGGVWHCDEFV
jgi:hypothetical protein